MAVFYVDCFENIDYAEKVGSETPNLFQLHHTGTRQLGRYQKLRLACASVAQLNMMKSTGNLAPAGFGANATQSRKGFAMKGTIFVELIKMAETAFGEETVDMVLDKADLENGGAFTAVGNYPCAELVKIVVAFSEHSGLSAELLQIKFGHWMLEHFVVAYPQFFADKTNAFAMLESIEAEIHVEVRKLYPEAELPTFATERTAPNQLKMTYESPRPLSAFCQGMIEACLEHFDQSGSISRGTNPTNANATNFEITLT